jgi:H+/Cl- antiporter ClcA
MPPLPLLRAGLRALATHAGRPATLRSRLRHVFFFHPSSLLLGLSGGALGASVAAAWYIHTHHAELDIPTVLRSLLACLLAGARKGGAEGSRGRGRKSHAELLAANQSTGRQ